MEHLPKPLQDDIMAIQKQLTTAIFSHQMLLRKLETNSEDDDIKKQMNNLQCYMMCLSANQKRLLQDLRQQVSLKSIDNRTPVKLEEPCPDLAPTPKKPRLSEDDALSVPPSPPTPSNGSVSNVPSPEEDNKITKLSSPKKSAPTSPEPPSTPPQRKNSLLEADNVSEPKSSPSTRSKRLLSLTDSPLRMPSPSLPDDPDPLEAPGGDLSQALSLEGDPEERKIRYLACISLVTHERAKELIDHRNGRKLKLDAMNPFIMLHILEPSQKRRKEQYLQSSQAQESSSECSSRASSPELGDSGSEGNGEQDQLFTEHQLETLMKATSQRPFTLGITWSDEEDEQEENQDVVAEPVLSQNNESPVLETIIVTDS